MLQKTVGSLKMCKSSAATLEGTRNFAIKLFGATISVPVSYEQNGSRKRLMASVETSKIAQSSSEVENLTDMKAKLLKKSENTSEISCNIDKGVKSEEKSPQKPEKPVSCPRCHSVDTKFCYFNNYNVNQPRHFCKNCRRYWTAGGTMRNIPVGAGRRKSKHFSAFQLSKSVDLQERKAKAENFEQSVQLAPVFDQTAMPETKNLPLPCLEKFDGVNSVGFLSPLAMDASEVPAITGFANLLDPGSKLEGMSLENNSTRWIPTIQQSGNSNILNCLVLSGRPLDANFPTK